jgi:hypothetical protein
LSRWISRPVYQTAEDLSGLVQLVNFNPFILRVCLSNIAGAKHNRRDSGGRDSRSMRSEGHTDAAMGAGGCFHMLQQFAGQ